jgi:hypothetical protein
MPTRCTPLLQQALLTELQANWMRLNRDLFRGALRQPALQLHEGERVLGHWQRQTRTLSMGRVWITIAPWGQVIEVLKHEMAHQFVSEVLGEHEQSPHGEAFRSVCERFQIDPKASGLPDPRPASEPKSVQRIRKLLALSTSPNEHEARAALSQAHRLMTQNEAAWDDRDRPKHFDFRQLGAKKGRFDPWEKCLAGLLGQHFFVHPIWVPVYDVLRGKTVRVLEINGRPEALEVAVYAHTFLVRTAETLWRAHRQRHGLTGNKTRRTFLLGVMLGFSQQLEDEAVQCAERGLVPAVDAELGSWFRKRHRFIRSRRGASIRSGSALHQGRQAGGKIKLRQALSKSKGGGLNALPG